MIHTQHSPTTALYRMIQGLHHSNSLGLSFWPWKKGMEWVALNLQMRLKL